MDSKHEIPGGEPADFVTTIHEQAERIASLEAALKEDDEKLQIEQNLREAAEDRAKEYASQLTEARAQIEALTKERDEFERKGKDLASAYGNSLLKIAALEAQLAAVTGKVTG